ncbi:MAG: cytochrome c oxidase subunit II [Gaiellaceae bacterium]
MRRRLLSLALPLAGALALAGVAAAENGGISPVAPVSPNGHRITDAYWLILGITGAVFLIVESTLLLFVIRYRRRGRRRDLEPEQLHGNTRLEVVWTVVPVVLLAVIVGFVFYKLPGIKNTPPASAAGAATNIKVEAYQFYWLFTYPGGRQSINVLTVPKDRVVTLDVTSADVAHSWWVPAFGGKIDAIPGKTNHTWFQAEKAGNYPIRCAEFCGIQHAAMHGFVRVTSGNPAPAGVGKEAFIGVCATCHGFRGEGLIGPAISASPTLEDPKALRDLVKNGKGKMPAVGLTWTSQTINAVAGYLKTRFGGEAGGGETNGR